MMRFYQGLTVGAIFALATGFTLIFFDIMTVSVGSVPSLQALGYWINTNLGLSNL